MSLYVRAVNIMTRVSSISTDAVMNTFTFRPPPGNIGEQVLSDIALRVKRFYTGPSSSALDPYYILSPAVSRRTNDARVELFVFDSEVTTPSGTPVLGKAKYIYQWTVPAAGGNPTGYPGECAIVMSFEASLTGVPEQGPGDTRPASRRRGRIYLGPVNTLCSAEDPSTRELYVSETWQTRLATAAKRFADECSAAEAPWVVYSNVDKIGRQVTGGFVNDTFDTQRRRGEAPQFKERWTAA